MNPEFGALWRYKLLSFTEKAILQKDGTKIGREAYLVHVADHLEAFAKREAPRTIINLPPSHLKSQLGAVCLPAWMLAANPALQILIVTHTEKLSKSHAREIRSILMADWYKGLCDVRVKKGHAELTDFGTTAGGRIMCVSFAGNFTGLHADIIIVDDPHDISDTLQQIERTVESFHTKVVTRLKDPQNGPILVIAHRLHERDLSGCLLAQKTWTPVVLPLMAIRDQSYQTASGIWDRKKSDPLRAGYTQTLVDQLRNSCADFDMLYQQDSEAVAPAVQFTDCLECGSGRQRARKQCLQCVAGLGHRGAGLLFARSIPRTVRVPDSAQNPAAVPQEISPGGDSHRAGCERQRAHLGIKPQMGQSHCTDRSRPPLQEGAPRRPRHNNFSRPHSLASRRAMV
jgi:hypothetical protein